MSSEVFIMCRENSHSAEFVEDFGAVCPEDLVSSSQWLACQDVYVMQFRHDLRELQAPPLSNLLVMINLSSAATVSVRINRQPVSRSIERGESVIIPAGTPSEWR